MFSKLSLQAQRGWVLGTWLSMQTLKRIGQMVKAAKCAHQVNQGEALPVVPPDKAQGTPSVLQPSVVTPRVMVLLITS
jgi:hypothetical protein